MAIQNRKCALALDPILDPAVLGVLTGLPGDRQQRIPCRHCHIVGLVGNAAGLRCGPDHFRLTALPGLTTGSRHRRYGKIIRLQIFQAGDGAAGTVGLQNVVHLGLAGAVIHFIAGDIGEHVPGEPDFLGAGHSLDVLHLGIFRRGVFRENVLEELDLFHHDFPVVGHVHADGDFFDRHPLAQGNGDHLTAIVPGLQSVDACGCTFIEGHLDDLIVSGDGFHDALFHGIARRTDNLHLFHLHTGFGMLRRQRNGKLQFGCALRSRELHPFAIIGKQRGNTAGHELSGKGLLHLGHVDHFGQNGAGLIILRLSRSARRHGHRSQIINIHPAIAVEVGPGFRRIQSVLHQFHIDAVHPTIAVEVALGKGGVAGAKNQALGIAGQGQYLAGIRLKAIGCELQAVLVLPRFRRQAGNGQIDIQQLLVLGPPGDCTGSGTAVGKCQSGSILGKTARSNGRRPPVQGNGSPALRHLLRRDGIVHADRRLDCAGSVGGNRRCPGRFFGAVRCRCTGNAAHQAEAHGSRKHTRQRSMIPFHSSCVPFF